MAHEFTQPWIPRDPSRATFERKGYEGGNREAVAHRQGREYQGGKITLAMTAMGHFLPLLQAVKDGRYTSNCGRSGQVGRKFGSLPPYSFRGGRVPATGVQ